MGQLFLFSLCNFSSSFGCVRGIPVTTHFSLLLIDRQLYFGYSNYNTQGAFATLFFYLQRSSELPQKPWYHGHNNRKWVKQPQLFLLSSSQQKSPFFSALMYALYGHPRYFTFKRKYQQYGPCFHIIFPFPMPMLELNMMTESKKWKK